MNVLHVVHGYPPSMGGTQRLVARIAQDLVANYGDVVSVFTTNAYSNDHFWQQDDRVLPADSQLLNGVTVRRFPVFNRFSRGRLALARFAYRLRLPLNDWARALYNGPIIPGMAGEIARSGADLVVASAFPLLHMQFALQGAQRAGTPLVFVPGLHSEDAWGFDRPMIYRSARKADLNIAYTTYERDFLARRGVARERIEVIGGGVDPAPDAPLAGSAWRRKRGLDDAPLVAFLGKQAAHKGIDTLLRAMPEVWRTIPGARVAIAGTPTRHSQELHAIASSLPPDRRARVSFLDEIDESEKQGLLAACDLLALPSRHESFGLVFLEAWAWAKPVIGARIGAVASVVDEGRDGLLVDAGDHAGLARAILVLLADPDLRKRFGRAGRRKALNRYSWEKVVSRFREAYLRAVADRG